MQRTATALFTTILAGFVLTGCPEKRVEKEEPAAPKMGTARSGVNDKAAEKAAEEEHGEDPEEHVDDAKDEKRPVKKRSAPKKEQAGEEKDQGGW